MAALLRPVKKEPTRRKEAEEEEKETVTATKSSSSLLTKYRPRELTDVVGQDAAVRSLSKAIKERAGRVFLFTGPSGTGKTTLAKIAASMLGCSEANVLDVDAATYTGIDDMRSLTATMAYRPIGLGGGKALIIDECHALSKAAWQSLLKPLEDSPPWAHWFLCTTEVGKVPAAAVTRALRYELKPVSPGALGQLYDRVVEAEELELPGDIGDLIIKEAHGSPRQLLANLAVCLAAKTRKEAAELLLSADKSPEIIELARVLYFGKRKWPEIHRIISGLENISAESARHIILAYGAKVLASERGNVEDVAGPLGEVMSAFSTPFNGSEGMAPLWLACMQLSLAE